jgi:hypothetical protein
MLMRCFHKAISLALAGCLSLVLPACGGGNNNVTPPTPVGPSQANITVTVSNAIVSNSPRVGFNYDLNFTLRVAESAGVGASFNFIRADFYTAGGTALERQEITATQLGRVPPSQSLSAPILISFNSDPAFGTGRYTIITAGFTDDKGNSLAATVRINF